MTKGTPLILGKTYSSPTEEHYRRTIFVQNVEIIRKHNYRYMARETTFFLGRGEYTDLVSTPDRRQWKTLKMSTESDQN